jgi:hypothetical protein
VRCPRSLLDHVPFQINLWREQRAFSFDRVAQVAVEIAPEIFHANRRAEIATALRGKRSNRDDLR